jgi:hypothetical protein
MLYIIQGFSPPRPYDNSPNSVLEKSKEVPVWLLERGLSAALEQPS